MVSEDVGFGNAIWQPYAEKLSYVLSGGDGNKTLHMKFRHLFLNTEETAQCAITLDTVSPSISVLSPEEGAVIAGKTQQ